MFTKVSEKSVTFAVEKVKNTFNSKKSIIMAEKILYVFCGLGCLLMFGLVFAPSKTIFATCGLALAVLFLLAVVVSSCLMLKD